jgi:cytochrome c-type biogenesis protein CcmF
MLAILISELGRTALITCGAILCSAFVLCEQRANRSESETAIIVNSYCASSLLSVIAIMMLTIGFIQNDFGLHTVWANSHTRLPIQFKLFNIIGSPQGSWLLWTSFTLINLTYVLKFLQRKNIRIDMRSTTLTAIGFCLFAIIMASPFQRIIPIAPDNGIDLNPLLQDPGFLIHPPCLYLGSSALIVPFMLASNHMNNKKRQHILTKLTKQWALWSWGWLTLGITLGSWWAYRELGWGGWWFWDPVENAALMPWLACTALIHACSIREDNRFWILVTSATAFIVNILGLFITRSGLLVSVHGFAIDPNKGIVLAFMLGVSSIYAITTIRQSRTQDLVSSRWRQPQNTLLAMTLIIAVGTLYPMANAWWSEMPLVIGAGYFEQVLMPFSILLLWSITKQINQLGIRSYILVSVIAGSATMITHWFYAQIINTTHAGILVTLFILYYVATMHIIGLIKCRPQRSMLCAHMLIIMIAIAILCNRYYERVSLLTTVPGTTAKSQDWSIHVGIPIQKLKSNHSREVYPIHMTYRQHLVSELYPEIRTYKPRGTKKSVTAIGGSVLADHYVNIHKGETGELTVRIYYKPLQRLFWMFGCLLGILGILQAVRPERQHVHSKKHNGDRTRLDGMLAVFTNKCSNH